MTLNSINVHISHQRIIGMGECVVRFYDRKNIGNPNNPRYDMKIIWDFKSSTKMNFISFIAMIYHEVALQFKENAFDQAYLCYKVEHQYFAIL